MATIEHKGDGYVEYLNANTNRDDIIPMDSLPAHRTVTLLDFKKIEVVGYRVYDAIEAKAKETIMLTSMQTLTKDDLEISVGYAVNRIATGSDKTGMYKMLDWYAHPLTGETFWMVHDSGDNERKFSTIESALEAYNDL